MIETVNHEDNVAMLAINEQLGFMPSRTVLVLEHTLR